MRIYFTASRKGFNDFKNEYETLSKTIKKQSPSMLTYIPDVDSDRATNIVESKQRILSCDVMIAEISYPHPRLGYEVGFALNHGIPAVILTTNKSLSPLIISETHHQAEITHYDKSNVVEKTMEVIKSLTNQISSRFTLSLTPLTHDYLNWISENKGIQRSAIIQGLIETAAKKDLEYKKSISRTKD